MFCVLCYVLISSILSCLDMLVYAVLCCVIFKVVPCCSVTKVSVLSLFFNLAFSLMGDGHCYRFPQLQQALCRGGGDSPQHRN